MVLEAMVAKVPAVLRCGSWSVMIDDITDDSRKAVKNSLFICVKGMERDGHSYIGEAVEKGAAALLVSEDFYSAHWEEMQRKDKITVLSTKNTRKAEAYIAAAFYGYPSDQLKVIGITGTKGKTTTSFMIRDILEKAGYKTGLLGTIDYEIGKNRVISERTTPGAIDIQRYLREMADEGCAYAVMEVSSQGLKLHRVDGIYFDIGVYTNLGKDHISVNEHASMEEYAACKALLFDRCRMGIGNMDDSWYGRIFENASCEKRTFSCTRTADYRAEDIMLINRKGWLGTLFRVGDENYTVSIPGLFSVYNALAAIAVCSGYGIAPEVMREALAAMKVKGRVETIQADTPYRIIIDYAHNAFSLRSVLMTMRRYHPHRLLVLFGCGGGRSGSRRREMGIVAGKYADFTVITTDNPRHEQPEAIMEEIQEGMEQTRGDYVMIRDRRKAIHYLLDMAQPGDILILAGKGHEIYQEIGDEKLPFDERKIVEDILNKQMDERGTISRNV